MKGLRDINESKYFAGLSFDGSSRGSANVSCERIHNGDINNNHVMKMPVSTRDSKRGSDGHTPKDAEGGASNQSPAKIVRFPYTKPKSKYTGSPLLNSKLKVKPLLSLKGNAGRPNIRDESAEKRSFFLDSMKDPKATISKQTMSEQVPSNFFGGEGRITQNGEPAGISAETGDQGVGPQPSKSPDMTGGRGKLLHVRFSHEFDNLEPYQSYFHEMRSSIEEFERDPQKFSPERAQDGQRVAAKGSTISHPPQPHARFHSDERNDIESDSDAITTDSETVCTASDTSSVDTISLLEACNFSSDEELETPKTEYIPKKREVETMAIPNSTVRQPQSKSPLSFTSPKQPTAFVPNTDGSSKQQSLYPIMKSLSPTRMQKPRLSPPRSSKPTSPEMVTHQEPIRAQRSALLNIEPSALFSEYQDIPTSPRVTPGAFSPTLSPGSSPRSPSPGMLKTPRDMVTPDGNNANTNSPNSSATLYGYPISYHNPSSTNEHAIHAREEFTLWANSCLKYSSCGRLVSSLERDLSDGVTLIEIVKVLVSEKFDYIPKYHTKPTIAIQRIENIKLCLEFLESLGMNLTGIIAEEIAEANLKAALAICYCLKKKFPMFTGETLTSGTTDEEEDNVDTPPHEQSSPLISPRRDTKKTPLSPTASSFGPLSSKSSRGVSLSSSLNSTRSLDVSGDWTDGERLDSSFHVLDKDDLAVLSWVSHVVDKPVSDYDSLQNGKVLCQLINKIANYNISDLVIRYSSPLERLKVAFQTAEERLGVFTELTPTDVIMVQRLHLVRDFLCDLWRLYDTKISNIKGQMAKEREEEKERRRQELMTRYQQEVQLCSELSKEKEKNKQREEPWNVPDFLDSSNAENFSQKFRQIKEDIKQHEEYNGTSQSTKPSGNSDLASRWKASPWTSSSPDEELTRRSPVSSRRGSSESSGSFGQRSSGSFGQRKSPVQDSFKTLFSTASAVSSVPLWKQKKKPLPSNKQLKDMSRAARMTMMARMAAKTGSAVHDDEDNDDD